jgi:hypothetical protein
MRKLWLTALLASALLVSGCGKGCEGRKPSSRGGDTSSGSSKTTPPKVVKKTPTYKLTTLVSKTIEPSSQDQTVSHENAISVTVPGGALKKGGELRISSVENSPRAQSAALQQLAVYDVSIGDQQVFDKELTIEIAYDPGKLRKDLKPRQSMWVGCLDSEEHDVWLGAPFTVDEAKQKLIVRTRHLSIYSTFMIGMGYDVFDRSSFFQIIYNSKQFIVPDPKNATPEQLANAPMYPKDGAGFTDAYDAWPDVPRMVLDLVMYLEKAYVAYRDAGFKMPDVPIDVDIGPGIVSGDDARNGFSEIISMGFNNINPQQLFNSSAHELFHAVQNMYYWDTGMHTFARREWWLDMTCEYACTKVARGAELIKPIDPAFFEKPLILSDSDHGQRAAHFLDYLIKKYGFDFKEMFETVAKDWKTLNSLENYIFEKTKVSLGNNYREFAAHVLFDSTGPYKGELKCEQMGLDMYAYDQSFELPGGYTAKYFGVAPETSDRRNPRVLIVEETGQAAKHVKVDILRLPGNRRGAKAVVTEGTFGWKDSERPDLDKNRMQMVNIPAGDALYVLVASQDQKDQTVQLKIYERYLAIRGGMSVGKGVIGAEYDFAAVGAGIPKDAKYTWDFGDNSGASGENATHKYKTAGEYMVKLKAAWRDGKEEASVPMPIAADVKEAPKAEANIYVFRYFKNKMGKSKRACQSFGVIIKNAKGEMIDGGFADARNGLFSIVLPVGHYSCVVNYTYTSPDDKGKASASFDVREGDRNWCEIETPPYEAFDK